GEYLAATAERRHRASYVARPSMLARRRLRLEARGLLRQPGAAGRRSRAYLHARLYDVYEQLRHWRARARDSRQPCTGPHLSAAVEAVATVRSRFALLEQADSAMAELAELSFPELADRLARLARAQDTLVALPQLAELRSTLVSAGLSDL